MKQFNLEEYKKNPSLKVVTRDGRPVRIICTDRDARSGNIVGLVGKDESLIYVWNNDGKHIVSEIPDNDLFFADEEQKPQSIEIPFGAKDSEFVKDEYLIPEGCEARIEGNKVIIEKIQKEDELTEFEKMLRNVLECYSGYEFASESDIESLKLNAKSLLDLARKELEKEIGDKCWEAHLKGEEEALKDLPKWKKITDETNLSLTLSNGDYYLPLEDLEKLPKEE